MKHVKNILRHTDMKRKRNKSPGGQHTPRAKKTTSAEEADRQETPAIPRISSPPFALLKITNFFTAMPTVNFVSSAMPLVVVVEPAISLIPSETGKDIPIQSEENCIPLCER